MNIGKIWKIFRGPTLEENIEDFERLMSSGDSSKIESYESSRLTKYLQGRYLRLSMFRMSELGDSIFSRGTSMNEYSRTATGDSMADEYLELQEVLGKYDLLPRRSNRN
ncbi:hypothetical protein HN903_01020 [archaeon]|jgi:hypothetical protein|nr:hypothetical protein [archaeon]MBT7128313.1 hypothetical protein [archaeon]